MEERTHHQCHRHRLHEEFKRRIKTQTVLPSAETVAMLFWALLAAGQITMRKVDGWQT
jgi:putative transposase